jgi:hypothetical protein
MWLMIYRSPDVVLVLLEKKKKKAKIKRNQNVMFSAFNMAFFRFCRSTITFPHNNIPSHTGQVEIVGTICAGSFARNLFAKQVM